MLKRWRYVGVFGSDLMLCAGEARVGPLPQAWWAVWERQGGELSERTRAVTGCGRIRVSPEAVAVRDGPVTIELELEAGRGVEVVTPDPGGFAWTAKHPAIARGRVRAGGREWGGEWPALIDVSAGYHPRRTSWRWSAGCGLLSDGRAVTWNLVEGIHDSARQSERTLWVDGQPREVAPVRFAAALGGVTFADGARLGFHAEATRRRDDDLWLVRSRYEQPFGAFSGRLAGGLELAEGFGVMERHDAVW